MSAPRPSRKGGKVSASPKQATGNSPSPQESPVIKATTPPAVDGADSLLAFPTDVIDHVAVGKVRGRGHTSTTQKKESKADKDKVEASVAKVLKNVAEVSSKQVPRWSEHKPPLKSLSQCDIAIVSDAELLRLPTKLVEENVSAKVLLVVPRHQLAQTVVHQLTVSLGTGAAALWVGSNYHGTSAVKIVVANQETALMHLTNSGSFAPFTHLVLGKAHTHTAVYQYLYAEIKKQMVALEPAKRPKVILSGFCPEAAALGKYFDPLTAWPVQSDRPACDFTSLSQDESYCYAGESITTVSVRANDARAASCHPKIVDANINASIAIIKKLLAEAKDSHLVIIVYTGDVGDTVFKLRSAGLGSNVDVSTTLKAIGTAAQDNKMSHIAVLHHAVNDGDASDAHVAAVIDHGTQRVFTSSNTAEASLPSKQVLWQNAYEKTQRQKSLGWHTEGLYFQLFSEDDEKLFPKLPVPNCSLIPMDEDLLAAARNGIRPNEVNDSLPAPMPAALVEDSLQRLSEHCAIVAPADAGLTFMGEFLSRLPLSFELATFVANCTALGLAELGALVASVATIPLRATNPHTIEKQKWQELAKASRNKFRVGASDLLADVKAYLAYHEADNRPEFAALNGLDEELLKQVQDHSFSVLDQVTDYTFREHSTPSQLKSQLDSRSTAITMLLAVSLSRRTVIVRNEGNIGNSTPAGNLMFIRSSKEVQQNTYAPTNAEWKLGNAVVSSSISNGYSKMFASDSFSMSTNYFFASLLLLHPCIDYSAPQMYNGKQHIFFSAVSCRHTKRLRLDMADGATILDFREKWNLALGCLQVKRSLPHNTSMANYSSHLKSGSDRAIHLQQLQHELMSQLVSIASEIEVSEHQATFHTFATHRLSPAAVGGELETVADATDIAISKSLHDGNMAFATQEAPKAEAASAKPEEKKPAAPAATAAATAGGNFGDDVEEEGTTMGYHASFVAIEEDDDVEDDEVVAGAWRQQGPLVEEDDE